MNAPLPLDAPSLADPALPDPAASDRARSDRQLPDVPLPELTLADSFGSLGEAFFTRVAPAPLADPYLVAASVSACRLLGVDPGSLHATAAVAAIAGNALLPGSKPLAAVYAGHQFGVWAGRLGDGRALLLGDTPGRRVEVPARRATLA